MKRTPHEKKVATDAVNNARAIVDTALKENSTELLLRHIGLSQLPDSIYQLTHLRILDVSGNQLSECDIDLDRFPELEVLDLSGNRLNKLPSSVGKLARLRVLYAEKNQLKSLPPSIGKLTRLEQLYASNNLLTRLPNSIGQLSTLHTLGVENNLLTEIPVSIRKLNRLERLRFGGNRLEAVPKGLDEVARLRELDLSRNKINKWPAASLSSAQLLELDISENKLTELPNALGRLPKLRGLRMRGNLVSEPTDFVSRLPQLKLLDLSHNRLKSIRNFSFGKLATLNLSENELTDIPQEIGRAKRLRHLYISQNHLTALPSTIGELSDIEILEAQRNSLATLPSSLGELSKLLRLDLSENALTELPDSLKQLRSLNDLDLRGNPNLGLPPEVLTGARPEDQQELSIEDFDSDELLNLIAPSAKTRPGYQRLLKQAGISASELLTDERPTSILRHQFGVRAEPREVLEYYFRVRSGRRPLNEAKLILLGRGGVGKTSLVRRLVHGVFEPEQPMTEGIEITKWTLTLNQTEAVRLNIWDFGGQEILHATHQFFLTQRAVYLVVLNGREGGIDADAEYWLRLIESFGGDSPVIVVLNKITLNPFTANRRFLEQNFQLFADSLRLIVVMA
jgi:internalin A